MTLTIGTVGSNRGVSSQSVTVDAGSNRIFIAAFGQPRNPPDIDAPITLNGVAPTAILYNSVSAQDTGDKAILAYWLDADMPPAGAHPLSVSGSAATIHSAWVNASGVAQAAPESSASISGYGSSYSVTVPSVSLGALVVGAAFHDIDTLGATAGNRTGTTDLDLVYRTDGATLGVGLVENDTSEGLAVSFAPAAPTRAITPDDDANASQLQLKSFTLINFESAPTSATINGTPVAFTLDGTTASIRIPGNLTTGSYTVEVSNATESATTTINVTQTHPVAAPMSGITKLSALYGGGATNYPAGSYLHASTTLTEIGGAARTCEVQFINGHASFTSDNLKLDPAEVFQVPAGYAGSWAWELSLLRGDTGAELTESMTVTAGGGSVELPREGTDTAQILLYTGFESGNIGDSINTIAPVSNASSVKISDVRAKTGTRSAHDNILPGAGDFSMGWTYGGVNGLTLGDEVWVHLDVWVPEGVTLSGNETAGLKWFRFRQADSAGTFANYFDLYYCEGLDGTFRHWNIRQENPMASDQQPRLTQSADFRLLRGQWNSVDWYVKLDNVALADGGSGLCRLWVNDAFAGELSHRTIPSATHTYSSFYFITHWNPWDPTPELGEPANYSTKGPRQELDLYYDNFAVAVRRQTRDDSVHLITDAGDRTYIGPL